MICGKGTKVGPLLFLSKVPILSLTSMKKVEDIPLVHQTCLDEVQPKRKQN